MESALPGSPPSVLPSICVQDIDHNPYAFGPVLGGHALQAVQATVVKSVPSPQRMVGMLSLLSLVFRQFSKLGSHFFRMLYCFGDPERDRELPIELMEVRDISAENFGCSGQCLILHALGWADPVMLHQC